MAGVLLASNKITDQRVQGKQSLDLLSVLMSAAGMGILVFGLLQSKTWGWVSPLGAPEISGKEITPFGISLVAYMILAGGFILWAFYNRQKRLEEHQGQPLLKVSLMAIKPLRSGLSVLFAQYLVIAAVFFVIPVYLQIILGYDALKTGIKILPMSVALILASLVGTRLVGRFSVKQVVRLGQLALVLGSLILMAAINITLKGFVFGFGMFVLGAGLGLLASQLGNVNMTAVGEKNSAQGGGLQGTFQNLGSSFGTALIGSLFIASLTTGFVGSINESNLPSDIKNYISSNTKAGVEVVSANQVSSYAESKGVSKIDSQEIADIYTSAQLQGIKEALFYLAAISLVSLVFSRNIPKT
jgi:Na+/melibiose symporter-like transporter